MPKKVSWVRTRNYNQQKALKEALTRAIKAKKKHLNSIEDVKPYAQMLIGTKEQYCKFFLPILIMGGLKINNSYKNLFMSNHNK
jgi:hypothetical protein